jgi:hypothetical protein
VKALTVRRPGRPTKQTDRTLSRLEEALTKGLPRWAACAYAKISRQTFNTWLQKPAFKSMVERWEAEAMFEMVEKAKREPKGNQFLLARRFRDDYGDKLQVEQSGEINLTVKVVEVDGRISGGAAPEVASETG